MDDRVRLSRRSLLTLGAGAAALAQPLSALAMPPPLATIRTRGGLVSAGFTDVPAVLAFKGIPYAAPPVGALRFAPPKPAKPWKVVRDGGLFGPTAMQNPSPSAVNPKSEMGKALQAVFPVRADVAAQSEDCLHLNVWTRREATGGDRRPVMVWLHGGGFAYGSGAWPIYDGARLADQGAVVVTLNHRLNVFGHLDLPEVDGSGNAGMLDIVAALKWVRDNIAAFGGDPRNVTIFGESGGGEKVSYLLAMPAAKGLFHRAVIQSGPGLRALPRDRAAGLRQALYAALGVKPGDVAALRAVPAEKLVAAAAAAEAKQPGGVFDRAVFSPVAGDKVLPVQPWDPKAPASARDVPVLIGINKDEMTLFLASQPWFGKLDEAGLEKVAATTMGDKAPALLAALKQDFPSDSPTYRAANLATYSRFFAGSVQLAERKAAQGGAKVWFYVLEWETPVGVFRSPHNLDLPLVFDTVDKARALTGPGPEPELMAKQMSAAWLAFARTGDPSTPALPSWPAYETGRRATMMFNLKSRVVDDPYAATRRAVT